MSGRGLGGVHQHGNKSGGIQKVDRVAVIVPIKSSEDYIERIKHAAQNVAAEDKLLIVEEPVAAAAIYLQSRFELKAGEEVTTLSFCIGAGYLQIAIITMGSDEVSPLYSNTIEDFELIVLAPDYESNFLLI